MTRTPLAAWSADGSGDPLSWQLVCSPGASTETNKIWKTLIRVHTMSCVPVHRPGGSSPLTAIDRRENRRPQMTELPVSPRRARGTDIGMGRMPGGNGDGKRPRRPRRRIKMTRLHTGNSDWSLPLRSRCRWATANREMNSWMYLAYRRAIEGMHPRNHRAERSICSG
jgi:hypothetical protein